MLGTVMNHYRGFMYIKYILALCLFCHNCCVFLWYMDSWMLFIFGIVTIYLKSLMLVRSKFTPCQNRVNWRILARIATVNQVIYDLFVGWFCPMSGGQNNHKLVINTPDLHELWVLKFHFTHNHISLCFLSVLWIFLAVSDNFSSVIVRCDLCTNGFSLITAKLYTWARKTNHPIRFCMQNYIKNVYFAKFAQNWL